MEISTGTTWPRCDSVAALYARQNSMMFTPCWPSAGPTGGAGVAAPAWICSLTTAASFLDFGGTSSLFSDLGYLVERQLDGRLPAEDRHQHLELLRVRADLADRRRQRRERPVHHGDGLADLEVDDLDLRLLGLLHRRGGEDADHLVERERRWAGGGADELGRVRSELLGRGAVGRGRLVLDDAVVGRGHAVTLPQSDRVRLASEASAKDHED